MKKWIKWTILGTVVGGLTLGLGSTAYACTNQHNKQMKILTDNIRFFAWDEKETLENSFNAIYLGESKDKKSHLFITSKESLDRNKSKVNEVYLFEPKKAKNHEMKAQKFGFVKLQENENWTLLSISKNDNLVLEEKNKVIVKHFNEEKENEKLTKNKFIIAGYGSAIKSEETKDLLTDFLGEVTQLGVSKDTQGNVTYRTLKYVVKNYLGAAAILNKNQLAGISTKIEEIKAEKTDKIMEKAIYYLFTQEDVDLINSYLDVKESK